MGLLLLQHFVPPFRQTSQVQLQMELSLTCILWPKQLKKFFK